jgi:hypothetical protein
VRAGVRVNGSVIASVLAGASLLMSVHAAVGAGCKPGHYRAPYFIKSMGACAFDPSTLSFAGTPAEQAMCLMRGMDETRNLGPTLSSLPPALASRVGQSSGLPSREALSAYLSSQGLEWSFAAYLWQPLSHARDNDPNAPMARYFVIHDTSGPVYHHSFPDDIDSNPKINNLQSFVCSDEWGKAHVVINRSGDMLLDHELSTPWRETKFEQAAEFGGALKGLFLHTEMIQPRRAGPHGRDARSPDPAFSPAQYDRLALLYVTASVRAGQWLIPAFHAALDAEIHNGHDDPLNFSVDNFAASIQSVMDKVEGREAIVSASSSAPTTDTQTNDQSAQDDGIWIDAQWDRAPRRVSPPPAALPPAEVQAADGPVSQEVFNSVAAPTGNSETPAATAHHAMVTAERETDSARERKTTSAESCATRHVKGHRRHVCGSDRAEKREGRKHAVRSVDREVSHHGHVARDHGGNLRGRHERTASRHNRA